MSCSRPATGVAHVQIADPAQRGFPKDDPAEPRYRRFFDNLRKIGYRGRISVEAESQDLTPTSSLAARRARENEITRPTASPTATTRMPRPIIIRSTSPRRAPRAMRMPISRWRWLTEYDITL